MTDHLEQYRRLARAIRFVPPVRESELTETKENHSSLASSVSHFPATNISSPAPVAENFGPPPDPSEHIAALVQKAVSGQTVLPVAYSIQENIGDRISRLSQSTETQPQKPLIILPKIPAPDPNWTPRTPVTPQETVEVQVATNYLPETSTNGKLPVEQVASAEIKLQENSTPPVLETQPSQELLVTPLSNEDSAIETPSELVEVCTLETQVAPLETPETENPSEIVVEPETVSQAPIQEIPTTEIVENLNVEKTVTEQLKNVADLLTEVAEKVPTPEQTTGKKSSTKGWIITEVVCPKCGSNKVKEKGYTNGQQKYSCKNCGKRWRVDIEPNGEND
ncbi:hypothetical protein IQ264_29000 [Phormidium sp. LEGE 05292]|uniref:IS1/IS1595 family N-terminal zinc-binding domain-containing protein n=1 Tax=[Phormidium] sp. LEGE 05292 TaxID=767427 RepID=UPI001880C0EC|nr:hypothetical protein [Phormidium sp. LEGE 05292]MBE9229448.1 hypothetical protein [Phormidium sp. LEGE 05292]